MRNFLKKRWYVILIIVLVIGFIVYQQTQSATKTKTSKQTLFTVKRGDLNESLSLSGSVDADEHVILRFQTSGRLAWVGVKEGDIVKKYQSLASLDQRDVKNRLQKYLNTFTKSRLSFDQTKEDKEISKIGGLSEDARRDALRVLDESQYDLNNSVLDVELQTLSLEYANLFTPIEGLIVRVDAPFSGLNISPAQAEFEIINPKTIFFSATADQSDVIKLQQGLTGNIVLDSFPDLTINATIKNISFIPKTGETGTVYEVKMLMNSENEEYKYRFGMTGDANFIVNQKSNVLYVPSNYIKDDKEKKYVMKKEGDKKVKTYVHVGNEIDSNTIITSGLNEGDSIYD
ncbi:MAG: efflux RND transporter periplasmic adaptor subunit [bacterium]|nr:efflux RND transporter periplasmic adaptor subunit [bacterium]